MPQKNVHTVCTVRKMSLPSSRVNSTTCNTMKYAKKSENTAKDESLYE